MSKKRTLIALSALCMVAALAAIMVPSSEAVPPCPEICDCVERTTPTFTRVGANCSKAQQNAINASMAAATCNGGETPCGSLTYWVSSCSTNHLGQTQASSFATYHCEVCYEDPDCCDGPPWECFPE